MKHSLAPLALLPRICKKSDSAFRMSTYLESTLTNPASMSSLRLRQAPGQDSTTSTLHSCLESLVRLHDRIDCVRNEMLELQARIAELTSCQSGVAVGDSGVCNDSANMQIIFDDEPQTIALDQLNAVSPLSTLLDLFLLSQPALHGQFMEQEYGPLGSVGVTGSLSEHANPPVGQLPQDMVLHGISSSVGGEQPFLPQHDTYSEGQTLFDSSEPLLPNAQGSQDKVKCTWPGCSRFVKKENRTRHVNEMHRRKVKAVCAGCGKGFAPTQ
ncbi:uncharacterized protein EDB91DRAFT_1313361 [Suillus paluster]|uniref:uncharacterized protein n=1 Tax=Suillus paluster TaxID=48578 RepID=UPI001B8612C9|nr:uncharacterized protein EDB91DRAFT_1313361 [Suillus paluster]KAG1728717.1 hypothetical protein EDB91DRAFT_1313361 [Suillus paluster]